MRSKVCKICYKLGEKAKKVRGSIDLSHFILHLYNVLVIKLFYIIHINVFSITKLLTFFLGFYVSQIMGRWWKQITANPSMEGVCLTLNGIVFSTTENAGERIIENEIKFKQKIARYCLLSWTMCFSNFSQNLKERFKDEKVKGKISSCLKSKNNKNSKLNLSPIIGK